MYDWGETPFYRSYTHHKNTADPIALFPGMGNPFQMGMKGLAALISPLAQGHSLRIINGPTPTLVRSWLEDHLVITHRSSAFPFLNFDEHNMVEGYICNSEQDWGVLTATPLKNKYVGPRRCNDQEAPK